MKRKLIASIIFDISNASTGFNAPTANVYWDLTDDKKPFRLEVRIAWHGYQINFPYKLMMKYLKNKSFIQLATEEIKEQFSEYKGKLKEVEAYYSEFGKCISASNNQEQIERWIKLKQI